MPTTQITKTSGEVHRPSVALLISDLPLLRVFQSIASSLGLDSETLSENKARSVDLGGYEMVVADEPVAKWLRPLINEVFITAEQVKPVLVALTRAGGSGAVFHDSDFDAVLAIPAATSDLAARLSVVLYSHRALAQRYQSALEELTLNRNIFRSVTNGISVANAQLPDMPLVYVNPSFELMTGYCLEDVEGKNCRFLQGDEHDQPGLTLIREAIAQQRRTVAVIRNFRKDGSPFWNEFTLSPIRNHEGTLTHFVGIQSDVTERIEFESALRESEKLAAVGRLASSISHEINNPLEAVMNLVYLAKETIPKTTDSDEVRKYLEQADHELQRVKLITAQSLRFYKQSSGPEAVLCKDLLETVLDLYRSRLMNYDVALELRHRSTQHIVGMASELRQVLSNLIGNAIDAMKSSGGKLVVRSREATLWSQGKTGVLITIADTGTGMSKDVLQKIYQAFYTTKGDAGTGLGLWITSGIVSRHRGSLKVRSSPERGRSYTVFQLFLPFQGASGLPGDSIPVAGDLQTA